MAPASSAATMIQTRPLDYGDGVWLNEFSDLSFRDPDTGRAMSFEQVDSDPTRYRAFCSKLRDVFCVHGAVIIGHNLALFCWPDIPEGPLPFAVCGFVAKWLQVRPPWHDVYPAPPWCYRPRVEILLSPDQPDSLPDRFPDETVILKAAKSGLLPACTDIIWDGYDKTATVMLDCAEESLYPPPDFQIPADVKEFTRSLETEFDGVLFHALFGSNPLPGDLASRFDWPFKPADDYRPANSILGLADQEYLHPGSSLRFRVVSGYGKPHVSKKHDVLAAAGILVRKEQQRRLISSTHLLHPHVCGTREGNVVGVSPSPEQEWKPIGQCTGPVDSATIVPGIELNEGVEFRNSLPGLNTIAKRLLPTAEVSLNDEFFLVSSEIGIPRIRLVGKRWIFDRDKDNSYALLGHRVVGRCISGEPCITETEIRDRAEGAIAVRCRDMRNPDMSQQEVLDRGEVWGMMIPGWRAGWLEVVPFDSLIEQGWMVDSGEEI
ncbi:hypothetical protein B0T14DRAFT_497927 [Immersiella caudata]|uniref:Uncharacterized protein n=1 Tax=Immersiella caudata TaxID=314043 RepID=A0AA39WJW1_9PEZI|nr:hypothetical protein B0T14DRAFT_497927 [Immersiella caudata]